jgi:hypothetical protein
MRRFSFTSWLRQASRPARRGAGPSSSRRATLGLEALEDRLAPADLGAFNLALAGTPAPVHSGTSSGASG